MKEAPRTRPDRLNIGEVREAEALDLVLALKAGMLNIVDALSRVQATKSGHRSPDDHAERMSHSEAWLR